MDPSHSQRARIYIHHVIGAVSAIENAIASLCPILYQYNQIINTKQCHTLRKGLTQRYNILLTPSNRHRTSFKTLLVGRQASNSFTSSFTSS